MSVLQPPAFWPTLRASLALFGHARPGLRDPAALPLIQREAPGVTLDAAWLARYGASVGAAPSAELPPLALQLAAAPLHLALLADRRFPFKALGLVHLSQQVTQMRAIAADARIDLRASTTEARPEKRGMSFCIRTEARCDGALVWQGDTRALAVDPSMAAERPAPSAGAPVPQDAAPTAPDRVIKLHVPENTGRLYAAIAGDLNPIHQRAMLARLFGFRRAIVHGTWTMARALALAGLPDVPAFSLHATFRRPVELPSDVQVRCWASTAGGGPHIDVVRARDSAVCLAIELSAAAGR